MRLFLPAAKHAGQWIIIVVSYVSFLKLSKLEHETFVTYVIEVTDLKSEVTFDLQGSLEAVVALEAAKRAHTI